MIIRFFSMFLFLVPCLLAQGGDLKSQFYGYYLKGDMKQWEKSLTIIKKQYQISKSEKDLMDIVHAQYGLIPYFIGVEEFDKADNEIYEAQKIIALLVEKYPKNQVFKSIQGAFIGFRLALSPWQAVYLGPQSKQLIINAFNTAPEIPEVMFEYANFKFWAPFFVGGDKNEALGYYQKTILLLEQKNRTDEWYYLWALTAYANAYKELEYYEQANAIYSKILSIEPNYTWVKNELKTTNESFKSPNLK